jgi:hypothetical protein
MAYVYYPTFAPYVIEVIVFLLILLPLMIMPIFLIKSLAV